MFEKKEPQEKVKPVQRRRKCLVQVPDDITIKPEIIKKEERQWKWKQKDVSELYNLVNKI